MFGLNLLINKKTIAPIAQEFVTSSGIFLIFNTLREVGNSGLSDHLSIGNGILFIASLVQAVFLGTRLTHQKWQASAGYLIAPTLYTLIDGLLEGSLFFRETYHQVFWGFSVGLSLLALLRILAPRLSVILGDMWRTSLFPLMYMLSEADQGMVNLENNLSIREYWLSNSGHLFIFSAALFLGLLLGIRRLLQLEYIAAIQQQNLQLQQLEQLRDDLTHMIVHDMKNPLGVVMSYADLLLLQTDPLTVKQREKVTRIRSNSKRLLDMTLMILDTRRLEENKLALQIQDQDVGQALRDLQTDLDPIAQDYHIQLGLNLPQPTFKAALDWNLIQRVLQNLVGNALKHSPANSTIMVSAAAINSESFHLSVADQGEGIAPEDQARIFEPFTQAKHRQGGSSVDTGLGLTFCKLAVEAHGGRILLQSQLGVGSTFTLELPLSQKGNLS